MSRNWVIAFIIILVIGIFAIVTSTDNKPAPIIQATHVIVWPTSQPIVTSMPTKTPIDPYLTKAYGWILRLHADNETIIKAIHTAATAQEITNALTDISALQLELHSTIPSDRFKDFHIHLTRAVDHYSAGLSFIGTKEYISANREFTTASTELDLATTLLK
jgi:hypothetical protein